MSQEDRGIVYCATLSERYLMQAYLAACSAKRHLSDIPVVLFTDQCRAPLAEADVFDDVLDIQIEHVFGSKWVTGKFPKIEALRRSPFKKTLYLDCDSRVTSNDVATIFGILDDFDVAMVECTVKTSYARAQYGRRMFNCGMVAYKGCARVWQLFDAWEKLTRHHHEIGDLREIPDIEYLRHVRDEKVRRRLLGMDQVSLVQLLSPEANAFDLAVKVLNESWNNRGWYTPAGRPKSVKIDHSPRNDETILSELLIEAHRLDEIGRTGNAAVLYDAVIRATMV